MLQFKIRELLLITLGVALMVGWTLDHRWQDAQRKAAEVTSKTATQEALESEKRLVQVQGELNEHILQHGPLLRFPSEDQINHPADEQTLELRILEPPLRDPDL